MSKGYFVDKSNRNKDGGVKPPSEKLLIQLQDKWLASRDSKVFNDFFELLYRYARSITLKINKGKLYLDPHYISEIALDSVLKVIDRYYEDPNFRIETSFAGWIKYPILEKLYGSKQKKIDSVYSLNQIIGINNSKNKSKKDNPKELLDLAGVLNFSSIFEKHESIENYKLLIEYLLQTIDSVFKESKTVLPYRLFLLFKLGFLLILRRPKSRLAIEKFLKTFLTPQEEQMFDIFILELRNRILDKY